MRVLVVEDAPRLANRIAEGLRDHGMAVDVAYDGHEAVAKVNVNQYDVVVLDRDLPGVHGDTVCQMIIDSDQPAMILMLTAAGSTDERVSGLTLGADDYLPKPFHFPELVLRIRALVRRANTGQAAAVRAAEITLDPIAHTASRDGRDLNLSSKEFAVLEALLRASPGSLTAEQLLQQAWDENADPFTNAVRVTIARLRRKLGQPALIQTKPGMGYRISGGRAQAEPDRGAAADQRLFARTPRRTRAGRSRRPPPRPVRRTASRPRSPSQPSGQSTSSILAATVPRCRARRMLHTARPARSPRVQAAWACDLGT
jgi:DNA-binding response OmpR family regulator